MAKYAPLNNQDPYGYGEKPSKTGYRRLDLQPIREDTTFSTESYSLASQILGLSDTDIVSIVNTVLQSRPHLRKEFGKSTSSWFMDVLGSGRKSARQMRRFDGDDPIDMDATPRTPSNLALVTCKGPVPSVQFSTAHYFVSENDVNCQIGVMRIGNLDGQSQVRYATHDISAKAGKVFEASQGSIIFQPGEAWQFFSVGILENPEWDVTQVFGIKLLNDGIVGAQIGRSLSSTHVHVINDDAFPSNKYAPEINDNCEDDIPPVGLLLEYLKLQWNNPAIRKGSQRLILVGQIKNLYFMAKLFMNMYLLKSVLNLEATDESAGAKRVSLAVVAAMQVIPFAAIHFLEWYKFEWKVGGMSRTILQKGILRKYLTCNSTAKTQLKDGTLIMGIAGDANHLVGSGYMGFIAVLNTFGNLVALCLFQFLSPVVFHSPPTAAAFVPMVVFPVLIFLVVVFRNKMTVDLIISRNDMEADIVGEVVETTKDYQMIMDFDCRGRRMEDFQKEIQDFNLADKQCLQILVNNAHFAPWIAVLLLAGYTYLGGCKVIRGEISLALYLTNVAVYTQMGIAYGHILTTIIDIQTSFPALLRITKLLNMPSDDNQRMSWIRFRCDTSVKLVKEFYAEIYGSQPIRYNSGINSKRNSSADADNVAIDMLPIWVKHLSLTHEHTRNSAKDISPNEIDPCFQLKGSVELKQGRLISIIGPHSQGKSTLLKVLGGAIMPDTESIERVEVFMPCHLRALHMTCEPTFFRGSLMDNITYGVRPGDPDGDKSRVKAIFRHLGLPGNVLALLEEDSLHFSNWFDVLSVSQRHLIGIARALVANPQVICIHKPTEKYSEEQGKQVLGVLRLFVQGAGLEQDQSTISKRKPRPRTCIMTSVNLFGNDYADDIIFVSRDGMMRIDKDSVREDMIR